MPANLVLGGVAAFIAAGRATRWPVAPARLTARRVLAALAVLVVLVLTMMVPTWYTMTHAQF